MVRGHGYRYSVKIALSDGRTVLVDEADFNPQTMLWGNKNERGGRECITESTSATAVPKNTTSAELPRRPWFDYLHSGGNRNGAPVAYLTRCRKISSSTKVPVQKLKMLRRTPLPEADANLPVPPITTFADGYLCDLASMATSSSLTDIRRTSSL